MTSRLSFLKTELLEIKQFNIIMPFKWHKIQPFKEKNQKTLKAVICMEKAENKHIGSKLA